jgi:hypothetical protein
MITTAPDWITTAEGIDLYRTEHRTPGSATLVRSRGRRSPIGQAAGEFVYTMVDLGVSIAFFVGTVTLLAVGLGLSVIWVGVPILAAGLVFARFGGAIQRALAASLLDFPIDGPHGIAHPKPGAWSAFLGLFTDGASWRAVSYHLIKIVLAPVTFTVSLTLYAYALGALTYPIWFWHLPAMQAGDGSWHRGTPLWTDTWVDTVPLIAIQAGLGLIVLLLAPRVVRALTTVDRMLIGTLLSGRSTPR